MIDLSDASVPELIAALKTKCDALAVVAVLKPEHVLPGDVAVIESINCKRGHALTLAGAVGLLHHNALEAAREALKGGGGR